MSYAQSQGEGRCTSRRPSPLPITVASGASGSAAAKPLLAAGVLTDEQRAQAAVSQAFQDVAEIMKVTRQLSAPSASSSIDLSRSKVHEAESSAAAALTEARIILERIPSDARTISKEELALRQAKRQKLMEGLNQSSNQLQVAWKSYNETEREVCAAAQAAAAAAATSVRSVTGLSRSAWKFPQGNAARSGLQSDPDALELGEGGLGGTSPGVQMEVMQEVSESEVAFHSEIAWEFAQDVINLRDDLAGLNGCMQTMAHLTANQGYVLDTIEANMGAAEEQAVAGREQVLLASEHQKKGHKRLWYILFAMMLVLIALISLLLLKS